MNSIKKIAVLTRPYWPRIIGGIILSLLVSGIVASIAWIVKPAIDDFLVEKKYEYIKFIPPGIVILFSLMGVFSFGQSYLMKSAGLKLVRETRNKLFNHIIYLPVGYFNRESSGKIISRVINDVELLNNLVSTVLRNFVMSIPRVVLLLGVAFYRSWKLTLMMLLLLPIIGISTRKFGRGVKKQRKEAQRKVSLITHKVGEAILGSRIIKVFNSEQIVGRKFEKENQRYYREMLRVVRLKDFTKLVIDIVTGIAVAAALWYGFSMVVAGEIKPGDLGSILVALYMVFSPVKKIGDSYNSLQESRAAIERVETLIMIDQEDQGKTVIDGFSKSIRFNNVFFTYPGGETPVLKDLELGIKSGEVIAVVGQSGAGKSTLVDLIPKFHKPSKGSITIDDNDINDVSLLSLRKLIGIVSQDIILFDDTVRENIAFGRPDAAEEEIVAAAKMAYADDFIMEMPDKYDTVIGERGLKLSGGQRQRMAIARAILKNPPILILDEATSSLDSVSEALVQKALDGLMKGRTTVVIAHRLSTIRNADRIVILDKGQIIDIGTHDQLISRNDKYMKLYNAFAHS